MWNVTQHIDLSTTKNKRVLELYPKTGNYGIYDNGNVVEFYRSKPLKRRIFNSRRSLTTYWMIKNGKKVGEIDAETRIEAQKRIDSSFGEDSNIIARLPRIIHQIRDEKGHVTGEIFE